MKYSRCILQVGAANGGSIISFPDRVEKYYIDIDVTIWAPKFVCVRKNGVSFLSEAPKNSMQDEVVYEVFPW